VDAKHAPVGAVEPGEDDHGVAGREAVEPGRHRRVELEPRVGRALVALLGRCAGIGQLGDDAPDRPQLGHVRTGATGQ
jgi:hypothetical protein